MTYGNTIVYKRKEYDIKFFLFENNGRNIYYK